MYKFRGKRLDNGAEVKGDLVHDWDGKPHIITSFGPDITGCSDCGSNEVKSFEVDPASVGQYTGSKDRKGNEIFKGDIFFIYGEYDNGLYIEDRSGYAYVDYNPDLCMYYLRSGNGEWLDPLCDYLEEGHLEDDMEQIIQGNVTDNPDLLKAGELMNLKPCPFCGKSEIILSGCKGLEECENFETCDGKGYSAVVCDINKDGCGASSGYYPTAEQAVTAWNRRAGNADR